MQDLNRFYVYIYFRPNGIPCYVGYSGDKKRWLSHMKAANKPTNSRMRNKHLIRIIRAAGGSVPVVKICENLTYDQAIKTEMAWITALGREDKGTGVLVNFTDGGEGQQGRVMTIELSKKMRDGFLALSTERKAEIKAAQDAAKALPEFRAKISKARSGIPLSENHKRNIQESVSRVQQTEEYKKNHAEGMKDVFIPKYCAKQGEDSKRRWSDQKYRSKMVVAQLGSHNLTEAQKKAIGDKQRGVPCPQRGRKGLSVPARGRKRDGSPKGS